MGKIWQSLTDKINGSNVAETLSRIDLLHIFYSLLNIVVILFITYLLLKLRYKIIIRVFHFASIDESKKETLISILMSTTRYILYGIALLFIIAVFVPLKQLAPLLAGAGVVGLALGFGAQNLVKDIITGFFLMFEDQLHVGDFVQINDSVSGTVEEMGLRMTTLREWSGRKFYIANSEIITVRNYNRRELRAIVYATFPYGEDPDHIRQVLEEVCGEIKQTMAGHLLRDRMGRFVEPPQVYGVLDIDQNERGGTFAITAKTLPSSMWTVENTMKEMIWKKCYDREVKLAYPRRILEGSETGELLYVDESSEN